MTLRAGQSGMVAVAVGALAGGLVAFLFAPSVVWAGLIGGALTGAAMRAGLVLFGSGDQER